MLFFARIFSFVSVLYFINVYGMQESSNFIAYGGREYPVIKFGKISLHCTDNEVKKIILKFPDKDISKKIEKIKIFQDGFAFLTKNKKPVAAVSCFDLAIVCRYNRKDFCNKMQEKLCNYSQNRAEILRIYLDEENHSFSALIELIVRDVNMINYIRKEHVEDYYKESVGNIIGPLQGGHAIWYLIHTVYTALQKKVYGDSSNYKDVKLFHRFSLQIDALNAIEFQINWQEKRHKYAQLCALLSDIDDPYRTMEAIDFFLGKHSYAIIYFIGSHKNSNLKYIPREVVIYMAQLAYQIRSR